jgi:hypothetical protein
MEANTDRQLIFNLWQAIKCAETNLIKENDESHLNFLRQLKLIITKIRDELYDDKNQQFTEMILAIDTIIANYLRTKDKTLDHEAEAEETAMIKDFEQHQAQYEKIRKFLDTIECESNVA